MYKSQLLALVTASLAIFDVAYAGLLYQKPITQENDGPNIWEKGRDQTLQDAIHDQHESEALKDVLSTLETMQDTYFQIYAGTWPDSIDWTAAVMGTHISATLSALVLGLDISDDSTTCTSLLDWENTINKYYAQTSMFYFAENAFAVRNQAYDDMLWVVLGWIESIKFAETYEAKRQESDSGLSGQWHGLQMTTSAAHRARIFYELASNGWDTSLCNGGMNWNPALTPYKNAITNELYTAASIAMYLYHPGDNNTSPFMTNGAGEGIGKKHDPLFLENAIKAYKWLRESGMESEDGLYQDGFHITGWHRFRNGTINPGTEICDDLNEMVYTYNQGVILSASRGLWLATGARSYLEDGHSLISSVIRATGWLINDGLWRGLGRNGVMEERCDHMGSCSQDGQTFKGIFFTHLAEFCRPLWPREEEFVSASSTDIGFDREVYEYHLARCAAYGRWIEHNAKAALETKDDDGLFGMWWGVSPDQKWTSDHDRDYYPQDLPPGAIDHLNPTTGPPRYDVEDLNNRGRGRTVETQSGGLGVLRAHWQWQSCFS